MALRYAGETLTYAETARFFVERGWAVLIPMRRGRGASDGEYLERYECESPALSSGLDRAIEDLDAVMAFVAQQPWVDRNRLLLGGMSRGGFLSIVYASLRPTGAKGVINFAGGWTADAQLAALFARPDCRPRNRREVVGRFDWTPNSPPAA